MSCDQFHRTILQDFYKIAFRKKLYSGLDDLQGNLDEWIFHFNERVTRTNHDAKSVLIEAM